MKKENILFTCILIALSLSFFLVNSPEAEAFAPGSGFFLLNTSETDLFRPLPKDNTVPVSLDSNNFLSAFVDMDSNKETLLAQKGSSEIVPIASLTKLITAAVVLDNYKLGDLVTVPASALEISSPNYDLKAGERFTVENLLHVMLIESNNSAAEAFAADMGRDEFISKMNEKAREIGMYNTKYINPDGLDVYSDKANTVFKETNTSTPEDLEKLVVYIIKNYPLISKILSLSVDNVSDWSGGMHRIENTNILLEENSAYLWGKTGYTKAANGCIILILKDYAEDHPDCYIINIITGADDRFKEARKLEAWLHDSFIW
jgi:serine-type D-Ala-D-Ala endopeptidase (penicillin-binding protein 7)